MRRSTFVAALATVAMTCSPAAAEDWSGFYAGVLGGYADGEINAISVSRTRPISGNTLGAAVGYRIQTGPVVLGIEADASWSTMQYQDASSTFALENLATLRAQIGVPIEWALPYLTAGLAAGTGHAQSTGSNISRSHIGFAAGIGVEVALGDTFSVKAEHLRVGLGGADYASPAGAPTSLVGFDFGVTRFGVNARF